MRHTLRLRVLLPALASAAALSTGCGGSTTDGPGSSSSGTTSSSSSSSGNASSSSGQASSSSSSGTVPPTYETNVCSGTPSEYKMVEGVTVTGVDYFEIRDQHSTDDDPLATFESRGSVGTLCGTATDKPKCQDAVAALRSAAGWNPYNGGRYPTHRYVVTTKGDTVSVITDAAALTPIIAPVDNAKDAALLATASGQNFVVCDANNARKTATGWEVAVHSGSTCGAGTNELARVISVTNEGVVKIEQETIFKAGDPQCAVGRRPEGLLAHEADACDDAVGRFFAEAAHLEAASVFSFARLADELRMLDAPAALIDTALSSREEEVHHARMTAKMAKRFGGSPREATVSPTETRSVLAIAIENATEGCVRETYGALVAHSQATTATDMSIRCMMQVIAEDETKHAGLAWDVAAWLEPQLSNDERELVEDARARAIAELRVALSAEPHADLHTCAGMPDAATAIALLDSLHRSFLAAA